MRLKIEKLVFGGYGIAKTSEKVILVEQVLPGEIVEAKITGKKGGLPLARPVHIHEPSLHRRKEPCRYAGLCGGCDWQHITYPAQVEIKRDIFTECLHRIGKIDTFPPISINASPEWKYRIRAQLKIDATKTGLGFYKKNSHDVVIIQECLLLDPVINAILNEQQKLHIGNDTKYSQIKAIAGSANICASFPILPDRTVNQTQINIDMYNFIVSGKSFFQGNKFINPILGTWAVPFIHGHFFIDMFGGSGFFSILSGKNFSHGILIESDKNLIREAKVNFLHNKISNIRTHAESVESFLGDYLTRYPHPECIIVDPPRPGLTRIVREGIEKLHPEILLYVSCNPSTQARDIGFFVKKCGYFIEQIALFDCYPQTHHMETAILLKSK